MQSQPTNFPSLTNPNPTTNNNKQQKEQNTSQISLFIQIYVGTYFKRARPPLVLPNVAHRID